MLYNMKITTSKRRGLSTVLTTIIILVASVVLGSGVVLYGSSLFQGETQQASIVVTGPKVWVNATDPNDVAWGAAGIRNSGDKILSVDEIQVRGDAIPYTSWYADKDPTRVTIENFQASFVHEGTDGTGDMKDSTTVTTACDAGIELTIDLDGTPATNDKPTLCLDQQSGPVSLNPGERAVVYFRVPDGVLSPLDSGASTSLNVFAGQVSAPQTVTVANP